MIEQIKKASNESSVMGWLAFITTVGVLLSILTPYVWLVPKENMNLITQGNTTLWNGWMVVMVFYFRSKAQNPLDAATISQQADTISKAQQTISDTASAATPADQSVKVEPGDKVEVKGIPKKAGK